MEQCPHRHVDWHGHTWQNPELHVHMCSTWLSQSQTCNKSDGSQSTYCTWSTVDHPAHEVLVPGTRNPPTKLSINTNVAEVCRAIWNGVIMLWDNLLCQLRWHYHISECQQPPIASWICKHHTYLGNLYGLHGVLEHQPHLLKTSLQPAWLSPDTTEQLCAGMPCMQSNPETKALTTWWNQNIQARSCDRSAADEPQYLWYLRWKRRT